MTAPRPDAFAPVDFEQLLNGPPPVRSADRLPGRIFTDTEAAELGRCLNCHWHPPTQGHAPHCTTRAVWGRDDMTAARWHPTPDHPPTPPNTPAAPTDIPDGLFDITTKDTP